MGHNSPNPLLSSLWQMRPAIDPHSSGPQQNTNFLGPHKASFIIPVGTRMTTLLVLAPL